ncbi:hypothetical protein [Ornithinibacillus sp. 179-J 7C1 HS]|uniref:hypothetical protein n=1 Tax=Ornithinibacillus sp. 179-J 7C1 HS TaxID=3142384 RepID=UPI00399EEFD9
MSGDVRNCKLCFEPMGFSAFSMCQRCLEGMEKVRSYVKKHPYAQLLDISNGTDLSDEFVKRIIDYTVERY